MSQPLIFTSVQSTGALAYQKGVMDFLPVSGNTSMETIRPSLQSAQDEVLASVLGDELTTLATTYDDDPSGLSAVQITLLDLAQRAVANLGYARYLPIGNVHVGELGITVGNTDTMAPASQWRVKDLRNALEREGWNAVQAILELLWANAGDYGDWEGDTAARGRWRPFLLNTAKELSAWWNVGDDFSVFVELRPSLRRVEAFHLRPSLGDTFYAELLAAWKGLAPSPTQSAFVLNYLHPAIANLAVADGLMKISSQLTSRGLLEYRVGASGDNAELRSKPESNSFGYLMRQAEADGLAFMERAVDYLNQNASSFPTWRDSTLYRDPDEEEDGINDRGADEDQDRGIYVMF